MLPLGRQGCYPKPSVSVVEETDLPPSFTSCRIQAQRVNVSLPKCTAHGKSSARNGKNVTARSTHNITEENRAENRAISRHKRRCKNRYGLTGTQYFRQAYLPVRSSHYCTRSCCDFGKKIQDRRFHLLLVLKLGSAHGELSARVLDCHVDAKSPDLIVRLSPL